MRMLSKMLFINLNLFCFCSIILSSRVAYNHGSNHYRR